MCFFFSTIQLLFSESKVYLKLRGNVKEFFKLQNPDPYFVGKKNPTPANTQSVGFQVA